MVDFAFKVGQQRDDKGGRVMSTIDAESDDATKGVSPYSFQVTPTRVAAMYLPWWGFGHGILGFEGPGVTGFSGWGLGYFLAWLAGMTLLSLRTVYRDADLGLRLRVADWFIFLAAGVLMCIFALTVLDYVAVGTSFSGFATLRYGWWLAIVAGGLVAVSGLMMRGRSTPVV